MGIFAQFKTSKSAEIEGILIRFKPNEDKTIPGFKIARACRSNVKWSKTYEAKTRPFKKDIGSGSIEEEEARRINIEVFVEAILLSWENIQDERENNITFTKENAIKLFNELPELYDALNFESMKMNNFLESNLKEDEKN